MDGVLADFNRGTVELCKMNPVEQSNGSKAADDELWSKIKAVEHFYDKLEPIDGAVDMFNALYEKYGNACEILSAIPKPKRGILTAKEDKILWAHRLLSESLKVNIVYREEKKEFCTGKDCILVDDLEKNITEWEKVGGTGILFTSAHEVLEKKAEIEGIKI